ncbi:Protein FAR1-RELATED SEQUENCE 11, partial [Bienertia sinuspersici]
TFASVMKKAAKTIITDQGPWICEAILAEMPATKHRLCIWHITLKFSCWFVALLHNEYQKWCSVFYMLYKMTSPEEFEHNWFIMFERYNLQSASINAFIKKFVSSRTCLTEFVKHEISQERSRNKVIATLRPVSLQTNPPLEKQAFEVLTPFSLKKFQEELARFVKILSYGEKFVDIYYEYFVKEIVSWFHLNIYQHDGVVMHWKLQVIEWNMMIYCQKKNLLP